MSDDKLLHCSLLIPSFQIDYNRPVMFWHLHQDDATGGSSWGYSTVNRLRPFAGLETMSVDDTRIVNAVAEAMAGPGKPFPNASAKAVLSFKSDHINTVTAALTAWDKQYLGRLAGAVCSTLSEPPVVEGFDREDVAEVIKCALLLLSSSRFDSFKATLEAAIIPQLRPDMLTTMYVLKKPRPQPAPAAPAGLTGRVLWGVRAVTKVAQAAVTKSAHAVDKGVQEGRKGVAAVLHAPRSLYRRVRRQGNPMGSGPGLRSAAVDGLPEGGMACRFYEAQCGDSLHVYNVDFNLCEVVRASTAAPAFFPGTGQLPLHHKNVLIQY
jgi:hypothetical protein